MITDAEKSDLTRAIAGYVCGTEREVLFAREVQNQGMDYESAAEYGISKLNLNKNALNTAYNQLNKTIGLNYI